MTLFCAASVVFWLGLILLFYTFLGYPLLMAALAKIRPAGSCVAKPPLRHSPSIEVIVAVHNEEQRVTARILNLLAADFPADQLRITVVSDGSTDATVERVRSLNHPRVQLSVRPERSGKAACLNAAITSSVSDLVVLTDVRQTFPPATIAQLAGAFADPQVGAASGSLQIDPALSAVGAGVDAYWRLEKWLRTSESRVDSCIGCTGAVYAIRRSLFQPIPPDTLLDDVVIPMLIAQRGARVIHLPHALAFDPQALEPAAERLRKRRTSAGNFQMLFRYPDWLNPWKHRLWWKVASHKYLRILAPWTLTASFVANLCLLGSPFYRGTLAAQLVAYALGLMGMLQPSIRHRIVSVPAGFLFLNLHALQGFWLFLRGGNLHHWASSRTAATPQPISS